MGTRSFIGKELEDGTVKYMYCHFDGYVEGVGKILNTYYTSPDILDQLIDMGEIVSLGPKLVPTTSREEDKDAVKPFDEASDPNYAQSAKEYFKSSIQPIFIEYKYLFTKDNKWVVKNEAIQFDHEDLYLQDLDYLFKLGQTVGDI